jgi:hypothetical protein
MIQKRTCEYCGDTIRGRSDKRFCDDTCRNRHHNKINQEEGALVREVNGILKRNRRILRSLWPEGQEYLKCGRQPLLEKGFRFGYHTHTCRSSSGQHYHFCYEYGYGVMRNGELVLVRRDAQNAAETLLPEGNPQLAHRP